MPKRRRTLMECEEAFRKAIAAKGGTIIGVFTGYSVPTECRCPKGHVCFPSLNSLDKGHGMCLECVRPTKATCAETFKRRVEEKGGTVIGVFVNMSTPVSCLCAQKHPCAPRPDSVKKYGICSTCGGVDSKLAAQKFEASIHARGGKVLTKYINGNTKVLVECKIGHKCSVTPCYAVRAKEFCPKCQRNFENCKQEFMDLMAKMGAKVIGEYMGWDVPVSLICPAGHSCSPTPCNVVRGSGICRACANQCPIETEKKFRAMIEALGGFVDESAVYVNSHTKMRCVCPNGHVVDVNPSSILQGHGMCNQCSGNTREHGLEVLEEILAAQHYSLVDPTEYKSMRSAVRVECPFAHIFIRLAASLRLRVACPECYTHNVGETLVSEAISSLGKSYKRESQIDSSKRRYDFISASERVIIEYDGEQHFKINVMKPTPLDLQIGQETDVEKMWNAIENGYRMLRIDYRVSSKNFQAIIKNAFALFAQNYQIVLIVTNAKRYTWLTGHLQTVDVNDPKLTAFIQ